MVALKETKSEEKRVVIPIPLEKQYIVNLGVTPKQIESQKGQTCWYYAYNLMRLRYKPVDNLVTLLKDLKLEAEFKDDENYINLLRNRAIEKEISAFRKFFGDIEDKLTLFNDKDKNKQDPEELKSLLSQRDTKVLALLDKLCELKVFTETLIAQFKTIYHDKKTTKAEWVSDFIKYIIGCAYGGQTSKWQTFHGFDALKEVINEHGALFVGGSFGPLRYQFKPVTLNQEIDGRKVYFWESHKTTENGFGHAVVMIGAEKLEIQGKQQNVIYYIDPNEPDRVFQLPFEELCRSIMPLKTMRFMTRTQTEDFSYILYINKKEQELTQKQDYQNILTKLLSKILSDEYWQKKNSKRVPENIKKIISEFDRYLLNNNMSALKILEKIKSIATLKDGKLKNNSMSLFYKAIGELKVDEKNAKNILQKIIPPKKIFATAFKPLTLKFK